VGKGKIVGPDLMNVHKRRDEEWLQKFITSPKQMIQSKDPYAVKLFEENNKILMPDHALKKADIQNVLAYIKGQTTPVQKEVPKEIKAETKPEIVKPEATALGSASDYLAYSMLGICFILITFVLLLLYQISNAMKIQENKNSQA
jgi:cbb3-type cytochrome oxidase cytochrome c subunit